MACSSKGTKLFYSTDVSSGDWVEVQHITNVSKSGGSITEVDITTLSSPGGFTETCPDTIDAGTLSATINLRSESVGVIDSLFDLVAEIVNLKVEYPDGSIWTGRGYLQPLSFDAAVGSPVSFSVEFRLTGMDTFEA